MLSAALLVAIPLSAMAQKAENKAVALAASAPGTATFAATVSISARVEAIDTAQRSLTLKGPKGNVQTFSAGPEMHNFDQI